MRNKITLAMAVVGMMITVPAFADASSGQGGGVMEFTGSVIDAPCSIKPESQNIQVKLSDWTTKKLNEANAHSDPVPVTIDLSGCTFAPPIQEKVKYSKVAVTFPDATSPTGGATKGEIINSAPINPAQNVVIQLLKADGITPVDLSKTNPQDGDPDNIQLNTNSPINTLQFFAQILATGQSTVGNVGATVTYKLHYF
ncbi:fimbrial protein [Salmonella enterica]|uniref:fimbrial protein n=1 Tax=Salmonella enterica TaxID=28901 RepID=UPI0010779813|nr:long polar fimbrial protein LpfA [Salmonella enterica subsp. enterica serovar Infantis]EAY0570738.1 long polar fimbrial protein LpfA [Salmonella enterica]EDX4115726.1 long polar fimbrial protein LpfA [Salmonella enterica subsp. enterica serovar Oranienburg]EBD6739059.1 long polar fimbrial protein LpfA [Salmonella enterica]EBG1912646.1 long polar fimbrial protein LpfA [Salmonella enterica]